MPRHVAPAVPQAATCQLGSFEVAAGLLGDSLCVRAVRKTALLEPAESTQSAQSRAVLGGVTLDFLAERDQLRVQADWRALDQNKDPQPPGKDVESSRQVEVLVSRVKVLRASMRGVAVLYDETLRALLAGC